MPIVRLSPSNVRTFKGLLRERIPEAGSSHLSEALAVGFGFRTHAALRQRLEDVRPGFEPLVATDLSAFLARLASLSGVQVKRDVLTPIAWSDELPDPCWRQIRADDRAGIDAWFHYCQVRSLPDIFVSPARKYATLEWDCISVDPRYEGAIRAESGRPMVQELFGRFQAYAKGAPGKPIFEGSAFVGKVVRLLPETARMLADEFFLRLYEGRDAHTA